VQCMKLNIDFVHFITVDI